jgi:hypothetical protein
MVGMSDATASQECHEQQMLKVTQAAWSYVNPPDGQPHDPRRYERLRDELQVLRRLELATPDDRALAHRIARLAASVEVALAASADQGVEVPPAATKIPAVLRQWAATVDRS